MKLGAACLMLLLVVVANCAAQTGSGLSPDLADSCDVFAHPDRHLGHIVTVRAHVGKPYYLAASTPCAEGGKVRFKLNQEALQLTDAAQKLDQFINADWRTCPAGWECDFFADYDELDTVVVKGTMRPDFPSWLFEVEQVLNAYSSRAEERSKNFVPLPIVTPDRFRALIYPLAALPPK